MSFSTIEQGKALNRFHKYKGIFNTVDIVKLMATHFLTFSSTFVSVVSWLAG
jgi:hypothetical protein